MAPRVLAVLLGALCVSGAGAAKTSSAKWAQTVQTVLVTVPLKRGLRGAVTCVDEEASIGGTKTLRFRTVCSDGETYELELGLRHEVQPDLTIEPDARRSAALITLRKATADWWEHLAEEGGGAARANQPEVQRGGRADGRRDHRVQ